MVTRIPPKIVLERHEDYRTIIESGVYGGIRPGFFEWVVYTDEMVVDNSLSSIPPDPSKTYIKRILQCRLILTAVEAKNLAEWLNNNIAKYEKRFGKIITPKELNKKGKMPPSTTYV